MPPGASGGARLTAKCQRRVTVAPRRSPGKGNVMAPAGFDSDAAFLAKLDLLRAEWSGFRSSFYILCAIRDILDDDSLPSGGQVTLIARILDERGWESGLDKPTLFLRQVRFSQ